MYSDKGGRLVNSVIDGEYIVVCGWGMIIIPCKHVQNID